MQRIGRTTIFAAAALLAVLLPSIVEAAGIGRVKTLSGEVVLERGGQRTALALGAMLELGDAIETGPDGDVGVTFVDGTRLALGNSGRLVIDEYLFDPDGGEAGFATRLLRGTVHLVSGLIAKIAPEEARVETPVGTVGIRGTRLLIWVEDANP